MGQIFFLVLFLTAFSFGGNNSIVAGLERAFVQSGQLSSQVFGAAVALGQATPGPQSAFATAIGVTVAGVGGALAATAGLFVVSFTVVIMLVWLPNRWFHLPAVRGAAATVGPLVTGLSFFLAGRMLYGSSLPWLGLLIAAGVAIGRLLKVPTALLMVSAVLLGALLM